MTKKINHSCATMADFMLAIRWMQQAIYVQDGRLAFAGSIDGDGTPYIIMKSEGSEDLGELKMRPVDATLLAFKLFEGGERNAISVALAILSKSLSLACKDVAGVEFDGIHPDDTEVGRALEALSNRFDGWVTGDTDDDDGTVLAESFRSKNGDTYKVRVRSKNIGTDRAEESLVAVRERASKEEFVGGETTAKELIDLMKDITEKGSFGALMVMPYPSKGDVVAWAKDKGDAMPDSVAIGFGLMDDASMKGEVRGMAFPLYGNDLKKMHEAVTLAEKMAFDDSMDFGRNTAMRLYPVRSMLEALIMERPKTLTDFRELSSKVITDFLATVKGTAEGEARTIN